MNINGIKMKMLRHINNKVSCYIEDVVLNLFYFPTTEAPPALIPFFNSQFLAPARSSNPAGPFTFLP